MNNEINQLRQLNKSVQNLKEQIYTSLNLTQLNKSLEDDLYSLHQILLNVSIETVYLINKIDGQS